MINEFFLNLTLAIIPGTVWLMYFLKQDKNPEPKLQIIKVFVLGFLFTVPVALVELLLLNGLKMLPIYDYWYIIVKLIFVVALTEEFFKYLAVRMVALNSPDTDEPIDLPVYMIISALGFATAENILVFFTQSQPLLSDHLLLSFTRFIGATLLHALASGVIGYFIALRICSKNKYGIITLIGFAIAVLIHALFDFFLTSSIMKVIGDGDGTSAGYSLLIVFTLFVLLSLGFKQIKNLKIICKK